MQVTKRELTIVDRSAYSVRLTLWGKQAEQFSNEGDPIIAWKGLKVSDFAGMYPSTHGRPVILTVCYRPFALYD